MGARLRRGWGLPVRLLLTRHRHEVPRRCWPRTPSPSRQEVPRGLAGNLCRCTGYVKIVDAIELAAGAKRGRDCAGDGHAAAGSGSRTARYLGFELALGDKPYINDMTVPGMLHGAVLLLRASPGQGPARRHLEGARGTPGGGRGRDGRRGHAGRALPGRDLPRLAAVRRRGRGDPIRRRRAGRRGRRDPRRRPRGGPAGRGGIRGARSRSPTPSGPWSRTRR